MDVIFVDFSQEIVWPKVTKKWPHPIAYNQNLLALVRIYLCNVSSENSIWAK